ncbi:hypothetical protein SGUI_3287 [Serinicoccus hydrothermalis]|uniref:RDD domain-containing protein n=1 Tax=Serinicoccus hydrothermalis TaxID=1758689 RepID=A0A1B1NGY6_9MICO|nr:RDD family protein [Serinicoccus hydrothermalis]ANS80683.1 hypothetical protein SGUI_3287 [Serinicoccus hydrothermalis]
MTSPATSSPSVAWRPPAPLARVRSWLGDWLVIGAWIGVLSLVGAVVVPRLELPGAGAATPRGLLVADLVFTVITVLPWWLYLLLTESSGRRATLGKRWAGLVVAGAAGGVASAAAVWGRNLVKVAPWQLAHLGVSRSIYQVQTGWAAVFLGLSLALLAACAAPALAGGRGLHDRVAGTRVEGAA